MSGRPKLVALNAAIANMEEGEDWVFARIAAGDPVGRIAEDLGVSRDLLYAWRNMPQERERRMAKWTEAMRLSAEAKAEEGERVLDDLEGRAMVTPADVSRAKAISEYKRWLASKRDPEAFGDRAAQVNVQLSVGQLHLEALKVHGSMDLQRAQEPKLLEAEVVEEEAE